MNIDHDKHRMRVALENISKTAEAMFAKLHGHKMDGPRNEVERTLLSITSMADNALNPMPEPPDAP